MRVLIRDYFPDIWVKVSPLDTAGPRRLPVCPHNWQLRLCRQGKQLGTELTPCHLSKPVVHVQLPRKYINIGNIYFLFDSNNS